MDKNEAFRKSASDRKAIGIKIELVQNASLSQSSLSLSKVHGVVHVCHRAGDLCTVTTGVT